MSSVTPHRALGEPDEAVEARRDTRDGRWFAREAVQRITDLPRVALCGRRRRFGADVVSIAVAGGVARYDGVQTCGSIWACPVCSARIRAFRQDEISRAVDEHWRRGGGVVFVTLTLRHRMGDPLARLIDAAAECWRDVQQAPAYRYRNGTKSNPGPLAHRFIRSIEITDGRNGWHAHVHAVLLTARPWSSVEADEMLGVVREVWRRSAHARTGRLPTKRRGVVWEVMTSASAASDAGEYLAKCQEGGREWGVAQELARGDMKQARLGALHPFAIARAAGVDGDAQAFARWREYEAATKGRRAITWSQGLRADLLGDDELTDDQIVEQVEDVAVVHPLTRDEFYALRRAGWLHVALVAAESPVPGGLAGVLWRAVELGRREGWFRQAGVRGFHDSEHAHQPRARVS